MIKVKYLIVCLFSTICISCSSNSEQQELINDFFSTYQQKGQTEAFNYAYSTNKWMQSENVTPRDSIINQLKSLTEQLGKYEGYELLRNEQIGNSLEVQSYLIKYERQPLRFNFIFYKSFGKWRFQEFQYDNNVTDEMQLITDISWYH